MSTTELGRTRDAAHPRVTAVSLDLRRRNGYFAGIACVVCFLTLIVYFREFLDSGFHLVIGNVGDNRFIIAILEHWRAVFHGRAWFTSPNFFWPERGVLGYSESLFLLSIPYTIARAAGLDIYLAFELTAMLFEAIGFFSMLWLLRTYIGLDRPVALMGAILFTLSSVYCTPMAAGHAQLMAIVFVPVLACLACEAWRSRRREQKYLAHLSATLFGSLLALVLFTSFYIGWFAIFGACIAVGVAAIAKTINDRSATWLRKFIHVAAHKIPILATATLAFSVAIIPFLVTYLPTLKQTGGRSFQEDLIFSPHIMDLLNVGQGNWIWGRAINAATVRFSGAPMNPGEQQAGWPPLTLLLVTAGSVLAFQRKSVSKSNPSLGEKRFLAGILGASFIISWLLALDIGGRTLWKFVFEFVPGGSAIRVPARFDFVLNVFVVISVCIILNELKKRQSRVSTVLFWTASLFLIAEQINTAPTHAIDRNEENSILQRVHRVPGSCTSFFLTRSAGPGRSVFATQIDAMLVARLDNLPTLNGYSGWWPPGWDLFSFGGDYLQQVKRWASHGHVTAGLCGLDLRDGSWIPIDFTKSHSPVPYSPGAAIDFYANGNADLYEAAGWGQEEPGGSWTIGRRSVLSLVLPARPAGDLWLTFRAHAFVAPQRPAFDEIVRVNGQQVADWPVKYPKMRIEEQVRIPRALIHSLQLRIEFVDSDPRSPAELGLSRDARKLGLAMETLNLKQAPN